MATKDESPIALSAAAAAALDALAKRHGVDRSQMVERLVFGTAPPQQEATDAASD